MNFCEIKSNLEKLGYKVSCFDTGIDASEYLVSEIKNSSVGICGSITVEELGLFDSLSQNNEVFWHWRVPDGKTADDVRVDISSCDVFLSSVNAIAESGEIINIDGRGDRVSNTLHGHKKVYFLVGKNKIEKDFDKALYRARNVAAPMNAKRLNRKTPCAIKGDKCYNCNSPERICRALTVLWTKPYGAEYEIVLINENLGY